MLPGEWHYTSVFLTQRALEQTGERNGGLQPLVAQLSEAINKTHMLPRSRQSLGKEFVCLSVCNFMHMSACCLVCLL